VGTQSDVAAIFTQRGFRPYFDYQGHHSNRSILANYNFKHNWGVGLQHLSDCRGSDIWGRYWANFRNHTIKGNLNYTITNKTFETRVGLNLGYRNSMVHFGRIDYYNGIPESNLGFVRPPPICGISIRS
jgi:hypothetical protein